MKFLTSFNVLSISALVGMAVDAHIFFPAYDLEITEYGLIIGMVLFFVGIYLHQKELENERNRDALWAAGLLRIQTNLRKAIIRPSRLADRGVPTDNKPGTGSRTRSTKRAGPKKP